MRVRILVSLSVVAVTALLLAGTTLAFFWDLESSWGNTLATGTIDLKIKDNNEPWGDGVTATWTIDDMKPGQEFPSLIEQIELKNGGTLTASTLDITVACSVVDPPGPESDTEEGTTDLDTMMELTCLEYEDGFPMIDLLPLFDDVNGNGWKDLDDLERDPIVGVPAPIGTGHFQLGFRFRPEADNDYQGDRLVSDFIFTLNQ